MESTPSSRALSPSPYHQGFSVPYPGWSAGYLDTHRRHCVTASGPCRLGRAFERLPAGFCGPTGPASAPVLLPRLGARVAEGPLVRRCRVLSAVNASLSLAELHAGGVPLPALAQHEGPDVLRDALTGGEGEALQLLVGVLGKILDLDARHA